MSWQDIIGHDSVIQQFQRAFVRGRLASSFLFVGPPGIGKETFARKLAQALLCENNSSSTLDMCEGCPSCQQVIAGTHPDLIVVRKPADKSFLPIELLIGDREHRMREGLCHEISLKPFCGGRKVAIISDADFLNQEGANCLLKTLEEPPPNSVLILIGSSQQKQLPTIRSRCQIIRFQPLGEQSVELLLRRSEIADDERQARELAAVARGSLQRAADLRESNLLDFREQLFDFLAGGQPASTEFAKTLTTFVDEAGKDATARRRRLAQTVEVATEFFRELILAIAGESRCTDSALRRSIELAIATDRFDEEAAAGCIDCCLQAESHIFANANQSTLIEWWVDELFVRA